MEHLRANKIILQSTNYENMNLVDEYGVSVYKFCRSLTYTKEDAEDLFQETFLCVLENPNKIKTFDNLQNFLFSTAQYLWKSRKRKYARRKRIAPMEELNEAVKSDTNIEESIIAKEQNEIVRKLVDDLSDKYKIPTILYYTSEMSVSNIAEILQIPAGTVKSRLYKARKLVEKGLIKHEK